MDSATIPPAPPAPAAQAGSGAPVTVSVVSDAKPVADLPDGAVITAEAAARAAKGAVTLTTADGQTVQVKVQAGAQLPPIPEGATLLLQVQNKNGEMLLRLLAINGRPLAGLTLPQVQGGGAAVPGQTMPGSWIPGQVLPGGTGMAGLLAPGKGAAAAAPPPGPAGLPGTSAATPLGLTATVIRPAMTAASGPLPPGTASPGFGTGQSPAGFPPGQNAGLPFNLAPGTTLTVRIAGIGQPDAGATPASTPAQSALAAGIPPPPGLAGTIAPRPGGLPMPAGHAAPASPPPAAVTPAPATTPAPVPAAVLLPGMVVAHPPGGLAVVLTAVGTLSVPTPADLAAGSALTLEVVGKPVPPPAGGTIAPPRPGLGEGGWPALSQALDTLGGANQSQSLEQLLRVIPQANPRLAASIAAFAGALRNGDSKALLPDTALRGLEKAGKKDVAERLKGDMEALTEQAGRPAGGGEWRSYTLPFLNGGAIEPIRLFVRKGDGDDSRKAGGGGTDQRFVVDLNLTQLGRLQMDGLVRREDKLFDLIIRSGQALPQQMRHDILGIFANASELVGTKGSVSFQAGGRWVEPPPDPPAPTRLEV